MPPSTLPIDDGFEGPSRHRPTSHGRPISTPSSEADVLVHTQAHSFGSSFSGDSDYVPRSRSASFSARFRQAGGVNSIDNFARSWQRAAGFPEVLPRRPSFVAVDAEEDWLTPRNDSPRLHDQREQEADVTQPLLSSDGGIETRGTTAQVHSGYPIPGADRCEPLLGTSYGTISSRVSEAARRNAVQLHREQKNRSDTTMDPEGESLLVKQVQHDDGTRECVVVGQSTVPQTIFNSVNVLIGIGLLSLPLAMKQAGWLIGLTFLLFAAFTTAYTAKILAKCLDVDRSLVTYADLAYISFGHHARLVTSLLFCLELLGACVALVVLFADSLQALIPGLSLLHWKVICGLMLIPLNFLPLRLLSVTSILGILSCTSIVLIICIDGLLKTTPPGSLLQPARTSLLPDNWGTLPLSFGLIMSPWGGHGVFPNIYRDMRHPQKYNKSLLVTYSFTYSLDCAMAIVGWLMFGDTVRDEITANILLTTEYPRALSICMITFIATIPITKVPLNCRPLVATIEVLCGLGPRSERSTGHGAMRSISREASKAAIRTTIIVLIVFMAVLFPSFDRIMALMGSALCFTICVILPLAFHLKIFGKEITPWERLLDWILLVTSSILALIGTTWSFMPQETISAM
ncbi:putative transporter [Aspergillus homomorphus CBS 101889]|uniref:Transporter n=1 Tax=Aspergillus homomorphus (strain CBS 101889) TaxID=1450537 RepID=A0A395HKC8_ASPHC|nr:transporter [Aspergillus homomorphus CBS 101889]RAL08381.1 transporter [Aspergillus homomorphus CBS 101889]